MKKKSLSVKKKNHNNFILDNLKFSKIKQIYKEFESTLDIYSNDKMSPLKTKLKFILENNDYEKIVLNAPVKRVNNSYEVQIHLFQSPSSADKVSIFRRSGINN